MGLLKTLLTRTKKSVAGDEDLDRAGEDVGDLEPINHSFAAAQAAIDAAVSARRAEQDRRDSLVPDRRTSVADAPEDRGLDRRGVIADRRGKPQGFGRRNRSS